MNDQILPLTGLPIGQIPPAVIVCGDPGRAALISDYLEDVELVSQLREYSCYRGKFEGMPLAVCSTVSARPARLSLLKN